MVALNHTVDENNLKQGEVLLPPANYLVQVVDQSVEETKSNANNKMIVLQYQVIDGVHEGAKITDRFNFWHSNPKAQEIARKQFDRMCDALGLKHVRDTKDLLNHQMVISIENEAGSFVAQNGNTVETVKNKIVRYLKKDDAATPAASVAPVAPASQPSAAVAAQSSNPWE